MNEYYPSLSHTNMSIINAFFISLYMYDGGNQPSDSLVIFIFCIFLANGISSVVFYTFNLCFRIESEKYGVLLFGSFNDTGKHCNPEPWGVGSTRLVSLIPTRGRITPSEDRLPRN